jgi:hypothetical protein
MSELVRNVLSLNSLEMSSSFRASEKGAEALSDRFLHGGGGGSQAFNEVRVF